MGLLHDKSSNSTCEYSSFINFGCTYESALNYNNEISIDTKDAVIKKIYVDGGPMMKRIRPRAQGRAVPIRKRMSHITVTVGEK